MIIVSDHSLCGLPCARLTVCVHIRMSEECSHPRVVGGDASLAGASWCSAELGPN